MIQIDKNWRIEKDNNHGFQLISETEIEVKDKKTEKVVKKLKKEVFYYPTMRMALNRYMDFKLLDIRDFNKINPVIEVIDKAYEKINSLKV